MHKPQSISKKRPFRIVILSAAKDLCPARDPSLRSELALERSEGMTKPDGLFFEMDCPLWARKSGGLPSRFCTTLHTCMRAERNVVAPLVGARFLPTPCGCQVPTHPLWVPGSYPPLVGARFLPTPCGCQVPTHHKREKTMIIDLKQFEVWFVTGSQHLYGPETLEKVAEHSQEIAQALSHSDEIPVNVVFKPVLTTPEAIRELCLEANSTRNCVGLITWMHTFSPAKMWIAGLTALQKPFVHLHTQYNRDIPWPDIDMDFMNLNQSAHGDREFGFIGSRMRLNRKVIVGHWQDEDVQASLGTWTRAACAWYDAQGAKIARFGDNMREVAVTEGDKVEAQIRLGYDVSGYGVGDLVHSVNQVTDSEIDQLVKDYNERYEVVPSLRRGGNQYQSLREGARIEIGLRHFLEEGQFKAFTTTFEDLHGLTQLPGLSVQRLMAENYGFGDEGDWKTAALVRAMKVMSTGLEGGTSFMEDYTYHLTDGGKVLGAHMLEVCPSISE